MKFKMEWLANWLLYRVYKRQVPLLFRAVKQIDVSKRACCLLHLALVRKGGPVNLDYLPSVEFTWRSCYGMRVFDEVIDDCGIKVDPENVYIKEQFSAIFGHVRTLVEEYRRVESSIERELALHDALSEQFGFRVRGSSTKSYLLAVDQRRLALGILLANMVPPLLKVPDREKANQQLTLMWAQLAKAHSKLADYVEEVRGLSVIADTVNGLDGELAFRTFPTDSDWVEEAKWIPKPFAKLAS
jgi:hypothetical protein